VKECEGGSPAGCMTKWEISDVEIREDEGIVLLILARMVRDAARGEWMERDAMRRCGAARQSGARRSDKVVV
jgi:hypothetical protein